MIGWEGFSLGTVQRIMMFPYKPIAYAESRIWLREQKAILFALHRIIEFACEKRHLVILCKKTLEMMFSRAHYNTEKQWNGRKVCRLRKRNRKRNKYKVCGHVFVGVGTVPKILAKSPVKAEEESKLSKQQYC